MKHVGDYELLDLLGRGAMGAVHRARHARDGRVVALKVVPLGAAALAARLVREAELARRLDHPGIVRVLDAGADGTIAFVAFELVAGARSLEQVLPELDRRARVALVRDVARALGHAHARGVVHRDVKPGNVLVDPVGCVRLTDFGVAVADDLDRLTRSGTMVGTPHYMSPEQAMGLRERIGPPADVWALGVLLHEALTGEHPLFGDEPPPSLAAVLQALMHGAPRRPRDVDPTTPPALDAVVARALVRDPSGRFPDGEAMARALDEVVASLAPRRRRRRVRPSTVRTVVAVVVLAVVAGAGWVAVRGAWARGHLDDGARLLASGEAAAAVSALRAADALSPGLSGERLGPALVAVAGQALARGDVDGAAGALEEAGAAPGAVAVSVDLALARGDVDGAAARLARGDLADAARAGRVARALLERAAARAASVPHDAAGDLAMALRLDPGAPAGDAAVRVAHAFVAADPAPLEAALALAPDDVAHEAWFVLAIRATLLGPARDEVRRRSLERALERARSPLERGEALALLDRRVEAREVLQPLADDPERGGRARFRLTLMQHDEVVARGMTDLDRRALLQRYAQVAARDPTLHGLPVRVGLLLGELGDPAAREVLVRARDLAAWHELAAVWQLTGYVELRLGDLPAARRALDEAVALEDAYIEAHKQRGLVRLALGDRAGARADLERVVTLDPAYDDTHMWTTLLDLRVADGDLPATRAAGERLRELTGDAPQVRLLVASALADAGDLRGAEEELSRVMSDRAMAGARLAAACIRVRVRAELGDGAGALADAEVARSIAPSDGGTVLARTLAQLAAGEHEAALASAERVFALSAASAAGGLVRMAYAWALVACRRDLARAEEELTRALELPRVPLTLARSLRALVRRDRGDLAGAHDDARFVLARLGERCPEAWSVRVAREVLGE